MTLTLLVLAIGAALCVLCGSHQHTKASNYHHSEMATQSNVTALCIGRLSAAATLPVELPVELRSALEGGPLGPLLQGAGVRLGSPDGRVTIEGPLAQAARRLVYLYRCGHPPCSGWRGCIVCGCVECRLLLCGMLHKGVHHDAQAAYGGAASPGGEHVAAGGSGGGIQGAGGHSTGPATA